MEAECRRCSRGPNRIKMERYSRELSNGLQVDGIGVGIFFNALAATATIPTNNNVTLIIFALLFLLSPPP